MLKIVFCKFVIHDTEKQFFFSFLSFLFNIFLITKYDITRKIPDSSMTNMSFARFKKICSTVAVLHSFCYKLTNEVNNIIIFPVAKNFPSVCDRYFGDKK